jgi:hypothetical protein
MNKRPVLTKQGRIKGSDQPIETRTPSRDPLTESTPDPVAEKKPASPIMLGTSDSSESEISQEEATKTPAQNLTKPIPPIVPPFPSPEAVKRVLNLKRNVKASKVAQTPVNTISGVDLVSLSKLPMTLQKVLKGNVGKLTSLVTIGGKTYVIKAGAGYSTMQDHITNTDILIRLHLPGVQAPFTSELSDDFRASLKADLNASKPADKQLLDALGTYDQISTMAPGLGVDSIFDTDNRAQIKTVIEKISGTNTSNAAVAALKLELDKTLSSTAKLFITGEKAKGVDLVGDLADPTKRAAAIAILMTNLGSPKSQLILSYMDAVSKQSPATVAAQLRAQVTTGESAEAELVSRVKTRAGALALGGMGLADLIYGMNDRIISKFNGGNFLFDPATKELWGVDNAKEQTLGLSSQDDQAWKSWFLVNMQHEGATDQGEDIGEHIHWSIYTRRTLDSREFSQNVKLSASEEDDTSAGMDDAVTNTLQTFRDLVNDTSNTALPKAERDRLKARLDFVDLRISFAKLLNFDEFATIPTATNPWFGKKLGRIIVGKVAGRTNEQKDAETWKNQARDPATTDATLDTLDQTVSNYLAQHPNADQRVLKALFAIRSERFVRSLKANTAALRNLPTADKAWGRLDASVTARVKAVAVRWAAQRTALDDKTGATAINTAMTDYGNQLAAV